MNVALFQKEYGATFSICDQIGAKGGENGQKAQKHVKIAILRNLLYDNEIYMNLRRF